MKWFINCRRILLVTTCESGNFSVKFLNNIVVFEGCYFHIPLEIEVLTFLNYNILFYNFVYFYSIVCIMMLKGILEELLSFKIL